MLNPFFNFFCSLARDWNNFSFQCSMDTSFRYIIITLIIMNLTQSRNSSPVPSIRKTRIAMDSDDDELSRKMVPKSIFNTPAFGCPPGYAHNDDGDCLRIIRVHQDTQRDFLLSRLKSLVNTNGEVIIRYKKDDQQHIIKVRPAQPSLPKNIIRPIEKHRTDTNEPLRIEIPII